MKNILRFSAVACAGLLVCASPASAQLIQFDLFGKAGSGLLTGNEHPNVPVTGGSGGEVGGGIVFDSVTLQLSINIAWGSGNGFADLTGNAIAGHVHLATPSMPPASFSEATMVLQGFGTLPGWNPSATNGGFNGTITLNGTQAQELMQGRLYINIHTSANQGGEIRGNMLVPEPGSMALLALGAGGLVLVWRRRATCST